MSVELLDRYPRPVPQMFPVFGVVLLDCHLLSIVNLECNLPAPMRRLTCACSQIIDKNLQNCAIASNVLHQVALKAEGQW